MGYNKEIKVKCINGYKIYNKSKMIIAEIEEKEYTARLYEETEEYFAKDLMGREFLVGEISIDCKLILEKNFELI